MLQSPHHPRSPPLDSIVTIPWKALGILAADEGLGALLDEAPQPYSSTGMKWWETAHGEGGKWPLAQESSWKAWSSAQGQTTSQPRAYGSGLAGTPTLVDLIRKE